ncbi:MAG: toprim domain-containing protein, partial [Opitutaceae bacterium]
GDLLFNLDRARAAVGEGRPFVLVEGQLDALRCWSVGLKTAVAPQGTALTDAQVNLLRRYHPQVECLFDSDPAGQKAALRLLPLALRAGVEVRFLRSPGEGKVDPDVLFLEKGLAAYDELRRDARSAMAFACEAATTVSGGDGAERKNRAAQAVLDIVAAAESEVIRAEFLAEAARHLRLSPTALEADFRRLVARRARFGHAAHAREPSAPSVDSRPPGGPAEHATPERDLLTLLLHFGSIGRPLSAALPHDWIDGADPAGALLNRILGEYEQGHSVDRAQLDVLLETAEEKALAASLLFEPPRVDDPVKIAHEGLAKLRDRALLPRLREIELALASASGNSIIDPKSLLTEKLSLQRRLRQPVALALAG